MKTMLRLPLVAGTVMSAVFAGGASASLAPPTKTPLVKPASTATSTGASTSTSTPVLTVTTGDSSSSTVAPSTGRLAVTVTDGGGDGSGAAKTPIKVEPQPGATSFAPLGIATTVSDVAVAAAKAAGVAAPTAAIDPERVLVQFAANTDPAVIQAAAANAGVLETIEAYTLVPGLYCFRVAQGAVPAAIGSFQTNPRVLYAEYDYIRAAYTQTTPYGISLIKAPAIWAKGQGSGVRIADLDTGVDLTHPDLPSPVLTASFISGETVQDENEHGTHTAGTLLARNNTIGVVGVAPQADLMAGKVLSNEGSGPTSGIIQGIQWAVANGARVINMSLGSPGFDQSFQNACDAAFAANVLVVAAAGNDDTSTPSYPGAFASVISVVAVDSTKAKASFSNFGSTVDVSAPGVGVLSTIPVTLITGSALTVNVAWSGTTHTAAEIVGTNEATVTGKVYSCGLGGALTDFPAGVAGNIALIDRGTYTFQQKATNAVAKGAAGVIIADNVAESVTAQTLTATSNFTIPLVLITQSDGAALHTASSTASGITATLTDAVTNTTQTTSGYATFDGASMASPHVAGMAALLLSIVGPSKVSSTVLRNVIENTCVDLGAAGRDDTFGYGLVDANAALASLQAMFPAACNLADIVSVGQQPPPDGHLTGDDYVAFINAFFAGNALADVVGVGQQPPKDGLITGDDYVAFINAFFTGCH